MTDYQSENVLNVPPDKLVVNAMYDETTGRCTNLEIRLNPDVIGVEELTRAVRLAFHAADLPRPDAGVTANTLGSRTPGPFTGSGAASPPSETTVLRLDSNRSPTQLFPSAQRLG